MTGVGVLAALLVLLAFRSLRRRYGSWPTASRSKYSDIPPVRVIPTRPDRRTLADR